MTWHVPGRCSADGMGVLVAAAVLAVVAQAVILVVARVSAQRPLLADVTPAYVESLTLRRCQLDGRPGTPPTTPPGRAGTDTAGRCGTGCPGWPPPSTGRWSSRRRANPTLAAKLYCDFSRCPARSPPAGRGWCGGRQARC
jgi:hypothetical protein